ncbi:hypothetical protein DL96DRAFT_1670690 [Flagelloscypha sp. PMI_526]|nr:hypothetical protein DL96DRAFT_1670690 [Flagelloscypha sp. PMI_526]
MFSIPNFVVLLGLLVALGTAQTADPCVAVAGKKYMAPSAFRACLKSFPFDEKIRQNVLTNVVKILEGFYTFLEYYDDSPPPFEESTVDIFGELKRINETTYTTDYDFSWDLYKTTNKLNDGHTKWYPDCYLTAESVLPAPVISLLSNGTESLFIAPDLNDLVPQIGTEFISYLSSLNFDYTRLAGARIISIEGLPAYDYVDKIAREESGNFLDHGIRVNSVYTSYRIVHGDYSQRLGDLAGPPGVERDSLKMTVVLEGSDQPEEIDIPYAGHYAAAPFTNSTDYWSKNCAVKQYSTNGYDVKGSVTPLTVEERQPMGKILELHDSAATYINPLLLPRKFVPTLDYDIWSGDQVYGYILPSNSTGVIFIGGFDSIDFANFQFQVERVINDFVQANVTHLIIDLTDNPGGAVCLGQFMYKWLMGSNHVGNPYDPGGFESTMRASPIAQKIVDSDIALGLTSTWIFWAFLNNTRMNKTVDYMEPVQYEEVNGKQVPVTPRFYVGPLHRTNIVIVGNGWCGSTCAMFATAMAENAGTPIVTFGGKPGGAPMEYKGCAGNQVLDWYYLSTEIKSADLENASDFRVNWRNAYSWKDKSKPIAYLSDISTYRFPYTIDTYMNPQNLWIYV